MLLRVKQAPAARAPLALQAGRQYRQRASCSLGPCVLPCAACRRRVAHATKRLPYKSPACSRICNSLHLSQKCKLTLTQHRCLTFPDCMSCLGTTAHCLPGSHAALYVLQDTSLHLGQDFMLMLTQHTLFCFPLAAVHAGHRYHPALTLRCTRGRIRKSLHLGQGKEFNLMLTQHTLSCFPLGSEKTPFTSLDLSSNAVLSVGGKQSFTIRDQTHTTYHFFFPSQAEKLHWMAAFQQIGGLQRCAVLLKAQEYQQSFTTHDQTHTTYHFDLPGRQAALDGSLPQIGGLQQFAGVLLLQMWPAADFEPASTIIPAHPSPLM